MPEDTKISEYTKDFKRLQAQKSRLTGGVESRVLTNLAFLSDEHYVTHHLRKLTVRTLDLNKLHLVFNLAGRLMNKVIGRLNSINGVYKARPDRNDPKSLSDAQLVTRLTQALDEKVGEPTRNWERLYWMAVGGVAFEYVTWQKDAVLEPLPKFDEATGELVWKNELSGEEVPDTAKEQLVAQGTPPETFTVVEEMQLTGDVGSEVLGPLQVFVDSSVRSVADMPPDSAIYVAKIRTIGWIEENFEVTPEDLDKLKGKRDLRIVTTTFDQPDGATTGNSSLVDLIPRIQGSRDENDPEMAVVVERYQGVSQKNPHGSYCVFVPDEVVLFEGENPYEEVPLVDFHWSPPTTNFWTRDYLSSMIAPQRFLNKRMSQLGEQANASIYANELLGPGLTADKIPADYPAPIENGLNDQGLKMVQRRDPPQLPSWFLHSIDLTIKLMREIAGGQDLTGEGNPLGQMRGPLAVPMLQEILDTEWGPLYEHIGERTARAKQMRINRVKKFYPPYRTMHYTNTDMKDEVFVFHTKEILGAGVEYYITVERGSLLPELRALKEERVTQRLNSGLAILYTDERTGQLDKSKIMADIGATDSARVSKDEQARKLCGELIERMRKGEQLPPTLPFPFWDVAAMMDELEAHMTTSEFIGSSEEAQRPVLEFWGRCRDVLSQIQQAQQSAMQSQMVQGAVAQASQQAAAQAAAAAIQAAIGPIQQAATQEAPQAGAEFAQAQAEAQQGGGQ